MKGTYVPCLPHWDFQYFFSYHLAEVHSTGISKYEKVCFNHLRAKSLRKWTLNQGGAAAIHTWLLCPATPTSLPNLFQFILICPLLDTLKGHFLDIYLTQICQECHWRESLSEKRHQRCRKHRGYFQLLLLSVLTVFICFYLFLSVFYLFLSVVICFYL